MVQLVGENPNTSRHAAAVVHRHIVTHAHTSPALDTLLQDALIINLCSVAALTWLLYDSILCFPEEVRLVWGRWHERKGRHTRRIYVIVRYGSMLNLGWLVSVNASWHLSFNYCNIWPYIIVITTTVVTLLPDVMILIRINAVYSWRIRYLMMTASLFFVQLITSLGTGFAYVSTSIPYNDLSIPGCVISTPALPATFTLAAWIPSVVAQCIYFALILTPLLSVTCSLDAHGRLSWAALNAVRHLIPTMIVFEKHGIIYLALAIGSKFAAAVIVLSQSITLQAVGIPWLVALYPILIGRLYLAMVKHLHFPRTAPHLPTSRSIGSVRLSYASALTSPHIADDGPITFAARLSLSEESISRLDFLDEV